MASDQGQHGAAGGESAMLRFFLPGLVVGTVLGSMLGLYVGTRSGTASLPELKSHSPGLSTAPAHDDEPATANPPAQPASEEKPAEKPAEPASEPPKSTP